MEQLTRVFARVVLDRRLSLEVEEAVVRLHHYIFTYIEFFKVFFIFLFKSVPINVLAEDKCSCRGCKAVVNWSQPMDDFLHIFQYDVLLSLNL